MKNIFDVNFKSRTVIGGLVLMAVSTAMFIFPDLLPGMDLKPSILFPLGYAMVYGKS